jgi:hypothetical protein
LDLRDHGVFFYDSFFFENSKTDRVVLNENDFAKKTLIKRKLTVAALAGLDGV